MATSKVKAVIVSHTYGVPCPDLEELYEKCKERNWKLIEDVSEVVGIRFESRDGFQR